MVCLLSFLRRQSGENVNTLQTTNENYINAINYYYSIGTILLLTACGGKKEEQQGPPPPTAVTAVKVTKGNATYYDEFPATVTALREVEIQPQVAGNITGIFFQDGQQCRKGQKLYTIDAQQYRAGYDQAVANLNVQKANLNRAQKDADRYTTLAQQDAIARQVVDNASATLEAAKMQVEAAQAAIRQVATNLKYTTIYAPHGRYHWHLAGTGGGRCGSRLDAAQHHFVRQSDCGRHSGGCG